MFLKKTIVSFLLFVSIIYSQTVTKNYNQPLQKKSVRQIIFWGPSENELDSTMDDEDVEVYSDYYYYITKATPILKKFGIELKDTTSPVIKINYDDDKAMIFSREQNSIGYIFNDEEQKPKNIKQVMTDVDIISEAIKFFHIK
jgi:hypothetical protein